MESHYSVLQLFCALSDCHGDSLWFWLGFVPGINVFGKLYIRFKTGEAYGKTTGFNIGMMLLPYIFRVILAFDAKTVYYGPDNMRRATGYNQQNPYAPVNDSLNSRENGNL